MEVLAEFTCYDVYLYGYNTAFLLKYKNNIYNIKI